MTDRYRAFRHLWKFVEWGHTYGSSIVHPDLGIAHVHIPKCASTTMKSYLCARGFFWDENSPRELTPEWKVFTITRDPVDRYLSALVQESHSPRAANIPPARMPTAGYIAEAMAIMPELGHPPIFDAHAIPQCEFVPPGIDPVVIPIERLDRIPGLLHKWGCSPDETGLPTENDKASARFAGLVSPEHRRMLLDFYNLDARAHDASLQEEAT